MGRQGRADSTTAASLPEEMVENDSDRRGRGWEKKATFIF
jgi:hypothetical protein